MGNATDKACLILHRVLTMYYDLAEESQMTSRVLRYLTGSTQVLQIAEAEVVATRGREILF